MKRSTIRFASLLGANRGEARGILGGMPLSAEVEILKDAKGIPHIFAETEDDVYVAQGFMHAYDRLWQLETLRRLPSARLAEVAGPSMVDVDHFSLLAGFKQMQRRAIAHATDDDRRILAAYVAGINAYIEHAGKHLPLEFRTLGIRPAEWRVEDLCGVLPFTSWSLQTNYEQELLALFARERLDGELFNELYPVGPGARLPREDFFERARNLRIAPLHPAALALYPGAASAAVDGAASVQRPTPAGAAGPAVSNCWVVREGADGSPLLANDPHLAVTVPQVWHLCHLHTPDLNVAGVSMIGFPGVILGRNERVAWGVTNVMTDVVDLYLLKVDRNHPTHYYIGERRYEMTRDVSLLPVAGGEPREVVVYRTKHGTVLSRVEPGYDAVVVLKWYGTLPEGQLEDRTVSCFLSLPRSRSVDEVLAAGELMKTAGQNLTAADVDGNIGWKAAGLVPNRVGYSGRVPADGSDPGVDWEGFVPYSEMPSLTNPPSGHIATANNKTISDDAPNPITYSWLAPYRHDRIVDLIGGRKDHTVESMEGAQMDVYSLQGEKLVPKITAYDYTDLEARTAAAVLASWDLQARPDSAGAAVFSVFLTEMRRLIAEPVVGEALPLFLAAAGFFYTPVETVLDGGGATRLLEAGGFDGPDGVRRLCEEALRQTTRFLTRELETGPEGWRWGELHTYHLEHSGGVNRLTRYLLNRGPYPAFGDSTTVNVSAFDPTRPGDSRSKYQAVTIPSMRLVTSLSDIDSTTIMAPMGQSGKPGSLHYDDMVQPWINGDRIPLPLSRKGAEEVAVERIVLRRER